MYTILSYNYTLVFWSKKNNLVMQYISLDDKAKWGAIWRKAKKILYFKIFWFNHQVIHDTSPGDWVIWQPNSTQVSVINLTSTNTISVQNYFTIDTSLEVKVYHHGTPVILSIKCISDNRQIHTLI